MSRALTFGAVLLLAFAALAAHAADTPAATSAAAAKAPVVAAAKVADGDDDDVKEPKDKYAKYEEGTGSDKGAKQRWKYLNPGIEADCSPFIGQTCNTDPCDNLGNLQCAPGSQCTPVCNNCAATCQAPLTCTGVKCPKYFVCEVYDFENKAVCVPAVDQLPTTCALGYVRVASTGACVRPSLLKVQGGNILLVSAPGAAMRKPPPKTPNAITAPPAKASAPAAAPAPAAAVAPAAAPVAAAPAAAAAVPAAAAAAPAAAAPAAAKVAAAAAPAAKAAAATP